MSRRPAIARLPRRIKNDPDVHHDVDEERILADERAQILPVFLEAQRLGFAGLDQRFFQLGILRQPIPAVIGGHEDEPEVVNVAIVLARRQRSGVASGLFQPELIFVHAALAPLARAADWFHRWKIHIIPGKNPSHQLVHTWPSCFHLPSAVYIG